MEQIDKLANFIMAEVEGEPSQSEGAGDTAIRIIKQFQAKNKRLKDENIRYRALSLDAEFIMKIHCTVCGCIMTRNIREILVCYNPKCQIQLIKAELKAQSAEIECLKKIEICARNLFDNRLGWSGGRNPYAPPKFWADLYQALENKS